MQKLRLALKSTEPSDVAEAEAVSEFMDQVFGDENPQEGDNGTLPKIMILIK